MHIAIEMLVIPRLYDLEPLSLVECVQHPLDLLRHHLLGLAVVLPHQGVLLQKKKVATVEFGFSITLATTFLANLYVYDHLPHIKLAHVVKLYTTKVN